MIRHRDSGKCYIGRSTNIRNRWNLHKRHTEQRKDKSPLHRAMRKYGYDAFDFIVLAGASAELHVFLEYNFIKIMNSMVPFGYNVGGVNGGQPSRELLDAMGEVEREVKLAEMRGLSAKMHATLAEKRKDPIYEAAYRKTQSEAAKKRWALRKERMATDPTFAAEANAKWIKRAKKAASTIKARSESNEEYANRISAVRRAAAIKARANDPRTIAAQQRKLAR